MAVDLSKATPRPWRVRKPEVGIFAHIELPPHPHLPDDWRSLVINPSPCAPEEDQADADLIVEAANNYDRLKRVERLAAGLANVVLDLTSDAKLFSSELQAWIDQIQSDARELRAQIGEVTYGKECLDSTLEDTRK